MKKAQQTFFTRILLLAVFASFAWIGQANAQDWDAPALKSTDPVSGSAYYIYNIGSDGFLNQGGAWSTQAAVSPSPRRNASTSLVSWTVTNVSGSEWTLKLTIDGSQSQPGVDDDFVASLDDANGTIFTDQGSGWGGLNWTVAEVDATNNIYTLQAPGTYTNFNASAYMGTESATESGNRGIANVVRWNRLLEMIMSNGNLSQLLITICTSPKLSWTDI